MCRRYASVNRELHRFSLSCLRAPRRTCWICDDDVFEMWRKAVRYVAEEKSRSSAHFYPGGFARLEFIFLWYVPVYVCARVYICIYACRCRRQQLPGTIFYMRYSHISIHKFHRGESRCLFGCVSPTIVWRRVFQGRLYFYYSIYIYEIISGVKNRNVR